MPENQEKWVFIVNPHAGNGSANQVVPELKKKIDQFQIHADLVYTANPGHATELAKEYAEKGYKYIIAVGGDGTLNEMAISLIHFPEVITGIVPAGTGNDFIQILGFPDRFDDNDYDAFFTKNLIKMDVGFCNGKIFLNGMGLGFDAQVAAENYEAPGVVKQGGKNKYIWHILKNLLFYNEQTMTINSGGVTTKRRCFINTISIGRRFAGAFLLTPKAIANDGFLDVCAIEKLGLIKRLDILMKVPKGTHIHDKKINYFQTEKLYIEFDKEMPFHLDGELHFASKFDVTIQAEQVNIIFKPEGKHFFKV